jgi:hypothetical protein
LRSNIVAPVVLAVLTASCAMPVPPVIAKPQVAPALIAPPPARAASAGSVVVPQRGGPGVGGASGCGARGGPGYMRPDGKCASWKD